ncbi:transposase, partial [Arthrospira platensis SPKY2]
EKINFAVSKDLELLKEFEIKNNISSIRSLVKSLLKEFKGLEGIDEIVFVMEHTGIYNNLLLRCLTTLNCKIFVCNGYEVKTSSGLAKGKNDKIDAIRIGQYAVRFFD